MAKVTRTEVDHYLSVLNNKLSAMGAKYRYKVQPVAGGYTLEKYNSAGDLVDTCIGGQSLRAVYEIIRFSANMIGDNVE
jgi:hypothetical protein